MHYHRIIGLSFLVLVGCKTTQTTVRSSDAYSEDLSYLRPDLSEQPATTVKTEPVIATGSNDVVFKGNIKAELDSVDLIIAERNKSIKYADGFTIQIYTGNDRSQANQASEQARMIFPDMDPQISYYQPTYKVKVGQFTNRLIAHERFEEIKKTFPKALLIPERIRINNE